LTWRECATFFGSNLIINDSKKLGIKWNRMIITRNSDSKLSSNLLAKNNLFLDKAYDKKELIKYCDELIKSPPKDKTKKENIKIRDYQKEVINLRKKII
jgi:hypothetical protein